MTSLHGKPRLQNLADSPDLSDSPQFHNHAHQSSATAAAHSHKGQDSVNPDMNDVAVHKFPVEKQLLLQMRLRQMHGRKPADLITTPAKPLAVRSPDAGMVSASHVGPPQLSNGRTHDHASQSEMQLPAATLYDSPPATAETPFRTDGSPTTARNVPSDTPLFEDLHHCEDAAAMQEAEAGTRVVQHAMTDPGIHAQWPMHPEEHLPAQQRQPVPLQHLHHDQREFHPSYAWSTQQLTAIAATAATAAAAAFQQEFGAKQTATAVAADNAKSAEQMQMHRAVLPEPQVRQGMQAATPLVDAETMTDTAVLGAPQQVRSSSLAPALLANTDNHQQLRQSQQSKKQQAMPKQSAALHKLKHRSSASRGLAAQVRPVSQAKEEAAPAALPVSTEHTDQLAADDHQGMHPQMQQVCSCAKSLSVSLVLSARSELIKVLLHTCMESAVKVSVLCNACIKCDMKHRLSSQAGCCFQLHASTAWPCCAACAPNASSGRKHRKDQGWAAQDLGALALATGRCKFSRPASASC